MRISAGLTQNELAQRLGCAHSAISKLERENQSMTLEMASAWFEACGSSLILMAGSVDEALVLFRLKAVLPMLSMDERGCLEALISYWHLKHVADFVK